MILQQLAKQLRIYRNQAKTIKQLVKSLKYAMKKEIGKNDIKKETIYRNQGIIHTYELYYSYGYVRLTASSTHNLVQLKKIKLD